jgi:hypothetical protein
MQLFSVIGTISTQRRPIDSRGWRQEEAQHGPIPVGMVDHEQEGVGAHISSRDDQGQECGHF